MLQEIWITRHGFREDWVTDNPHLPTNLKNDPPLSELGREQAQELGAFLKDKGIERVYSSPFYRVLQTVYPLIEETDVPLHLDNCMSEWYGAAYDRYLPPAPFEKLKELFPKLDLSHESSIPLPVGVETVSICHQRVRDGLETLLDELDKEPNGPSSILLAGHAASVICAVRALLGDETFPVRSGTASLSKFVRKDNGEGWELVMHGDCSHLSKGEQRAWMFSGDIPDYEKKKMEEGVDESPRIVEHHTHS
ncbi:histidine phosphatase superfamily [Radiomyces spectabilis]|uniref:histidine phosphatase superfamily n=1 Tax=Radiomyces spectabilis TaxID=64574 RepID=UPI00221F9EEA|nr:histidine phosphatase superfamily [Radiomyces spectabilis]KAI8384764.1 histidine phosphatase superfamily [Radiomyces spectabilis]